MQVLDDLGDRSPPKVREAYFQQIDTDGSGAIDFEEFLGVSQLQVINNFKEKEVLRMWPNLSTFFLGT